MDVIHDYLDITVHLTLFSATITEDIPQMLEHYNVKRITSAEISSYKFLPADVETLKKIKETYLSTAEENKMGRASTKENKNRYQLAREELNLTREQASIELKVISEDRIEKIENERMEPQPYDVLVMAQGYKKPSLCNYYCSHECPIGKQYVPEVQVKELSAIVLEMLASLNSVNKQKDRLIEITADGKISGDEIDDFIYIQEELERISITVETLQLWAEKMLANGVIDADAYNARKNK